jgi:hypothetical protein
MLNYDKVVQVAMEKLDDIIDNYLELTGEDSLLDDLSTYEIMDYLSKRYNVEFIEQTHYYMRYK